MNIFGDGIHGALKNYRAQADRMGEGRYVGRNWIVHDKLCIQLLSVPFWPASVPVGECIGARLRSPFTLKPDGPHSVIILPKTPASPFESRACSYRDYLQKNAIYQRQRESFR